VPNAIHLALEDKFTNLLNRPTNTALNRDAVFASWDGSFDGILPRRYERGLNP
jgi:hypothetical protein